MLSSARQRVLAAVVDESFMVLFRPWLMPSRLIESEKLHVAFRYGPNLQLSKAQE
jgi:hypothetical protein